MPTKACFGKIGITTGKYFDKEWLQINKKHYYVKTTNFFSSNFTTFSLHLYTLLVQT
jgi:hypothetical protein